MNYIEKLKKYIWEDYGKPCELSEMFNNDYTFIELHEPTLIAVVHKCDRTASTFIYSYESDNFKILDKIF